MDREAYIALVIAAILLAGGAWYIHNNPHGFSHTVAAAGPKFWIYTAKFDGTRIGAPRTAMESNGECAGIRITDPPVVAEEDQINKEWCVKGGGIEYIDNEPLPAGTQIPMTTEVVAAVEGRT